jgi:hypothetical protein
MKPVIEFIVRPDERTSVRLLKATVAALSLQSKRHDTVVSLAVGADRSPHRSSSTVDQRVKASTADFVAVVSPGDYLSPASLDEIVSRCSLDRDATLITTRSEHFDGAVGQIIGPDRGGALPLLEDVAFVSPEGQFQQTFRVFRQASVSQTAWDPAATGYEAEHYMFSTFSPSSHVHLDAPVFHRRGIAESGSDLTVATSTFLNTSRAQAHARLGVGQARPGQATIFSQASSMSLPDDRLIWLEPESFLDALALSLQLRSTAHVDVGLYVDSKQAWQWEFARLYNSFFDYIYLSTKALTPIIGPHVNSSTRIHFPPDEI